MMCIVNWRDYNLIQTFIVFEFPETFAGCLSLVDVFSLAHTHNTTLFQYLSGLFHQQTPTSSGWGLTDSTAEKPDGIASSSQFPKYSLVSRGCGEMFKKRGNDGRTLSLL